MYRISRTRAFDRSLLKLKRSGMLKKSVLQDLGVAINTLRDGGSLPRTYRDHALTGDLQGYRDCHIKGDLLLIYTIRNNELVLEDIGSHSQLFG